MKRARPRRRCSRQGHAFGDAGHAGGLVRGAGKARPAGATADGVSAVVDLVRTGWGARAGGLIVVRVMVVRACAAMRERAGARAAGGGVRAPALEWPRRQARTAGPHTTPAGQALLETQGMGLHVWLVAVMVQVKFAGHLPHLILPPQPLFCEGA